MKEIGKMTEQAVMAGLFTRMVVATMAIGEITRLMVMEFMKITIINMLDFGKIIA